MATRTVRLEAGEELFHRGERGHRIYRVRAGRLRAGATSPAGREVVFSILGPGEWVGELSLLAGGPRSATVVALERCDLTAFERDEVTSLLRSDADAAVRLLKRLAQRLRDMSERVEDHAFLDVSARLAKTLLQLGERFGEPEAQGLRIDLRLSQEELGALVAATRESVNKYLRAWMDAGIVARDGGRIVLLDRERLAGLGAQSAEIERGAIEA